VSTVIRHPIARVVVDGRTLTSAEAAIARVEVRLGLGGEHDSARVLLWLRSKAAGIEPDAPVSIALGNRDDIVDVWGGKVAHVTTGDRQVVIDGLAHTAQLSRTRVTKTWQEQTVADIVRDLAADVEMDEIDASLSLPWYAVDTRRTVWSHLRDLAHLVGADLAASAAGAVRFVPARTAGEVHSLRFGAHVLRWNVGALQTSEPPALRAYGAASEAGSQQWHWLLGDAGDAVGLTPGAIRTKDAADAATRARQDRAARRGQRGTALAVGSPAVRPGDTVKLEDVPGAAASGYRVTAVLHQLDGRTGFTTSLRMEGLAA
jgi:phage protein D